MLDCLSIFRRERPPVYREPLVRPTTHGKSINRNDTGNHYCRRLSVASDNNIIIIVVIVNKGRGKRFYTYLLPERPHTHTCIVYMYVREKNRKIVFFFLSFPDRFTVHKSSIVLAILDRRGRHLKIKSPGVPSPSATHSHSIGLHHPPPPTATSPRSEPVL